MDKTSCPVPVGRSARVQVHMPGRPQEHVVLVQPRDGGWAVQDAHALFGIRIDTRNGAPGAASTAFAASSLTTKLAR